MQPPLAELEAGLELAALGIEGALPEQMAGEVAFCSQPNCGGVLRRRGQGWACPICGTRYGSNAGVSTAGTSGPPQAHTKGARRSTRDKHTKPRAGGPEKKDRRRQREFELELEDAAEAMASPPRGQAGRFPARHLPRHLRRQGFRVTRHFLDRLVERAQAQGIRFDPRSFRDEFRKAQHFRQTRPGYNTRIALMRGIPVLYRMGGWRGLNPGTIGLLPQGALPPSEPVTSPRLHEKELEYELALAASALQSAPGWHEGGRKPNDVTSLTFGRPRRFFDLWQGLQGELEVAYQESNSAGELEYVPSAVRITFENAVRSENWRQAFLNLNGLNMFEMLRALDGLDAGSLARLWAQRAAFLWMVDMPRIEYARSVVELRTLPAVAPGDLQDTGQVGDAADFLAEKFSPVALAINPNPVQSIRLILLECNFYGITDKSHIAYVLASAHHESGMGRFMAEFADGTAYEGRLDLGNTQPGDGPRFKGRGFVQITGRRNYTLYTGILSVTRDPDVDLVNNPGRAAEPAIAAMILAHGMSNGTFTGRRLSDFGLDGNYNFVQARRIVNGLDRANAIAAIARSYRALMR